MADRTALIAGGGIGGLTAALCLSRQGWAVRLFEQTAEFAEIGAGIQLSPNATRVLHEVGLQDALADVAFVPEATEMRDWKSGRVLSRTPLGATARAKFGAPYLHVHRADLLDSLLASARAERRIELRTYAPVSDVRQSGTLVSVDAGCIRYDGDVLVGADGIHSTVRAALFGPDAPRFTGNVAWRALVPANDLPKGLIRPVTSAWLGPHRHFVHYYVRRGEFVNCVCVVEKRGWEIESWTEPGDHAELARDFANWHPDIRTLIDAMDRGSLFKWALFDRAPLPQWSRGHATLLGDACHPTLPFMAQGAAMAIEDGAVLARCLAANDDVEAALVRYETLRRPRTARIQAGSRRNATVFHLSGVQAWLRNRALQVAQTNAMDWLYGYDAFGAGEP